MFLLYKFFWREAVQWESSTGGAPLLECLAAEESLAQFGPLYGNLESVPSGSIIIMEDDTPDVLIRYGGRGISRDWEEAVQGLDFQSAGAREDNSVCNQLSTL